jgi:methyl-accepting chemotaxis protein
LNYRLTKAVDPTYEKLRVDFNTAIENLDKTITAISASVNAVGEWCQRDRHSLHDLARRTEVQAANLEETAATLNQITTTVTRSAQGAKEASASASAVRADAGKSGEVVGDAVAAMGRIRTSRRRFRRSPD